MNKVHIFWASMVSVNTPHRINSAPIQNRIFWTSGYIVRVYQALTSKTYTQSKNTDGKKKRPVKLASSKTT